MTMTMTMINVP